MDNHLNAYTALLYKKIDKHFIYDTFFTFLLAGKIFCTSLHCALFRYFRDKLSHRPAEIRAFVEVWIH